MMSASGHVELKEMDMATKIDAGARAVAGQTFYEVSTGPKKITAAELLERSKGGKYVSCLFGFHGVPKGMTEHQFAEQVERALQAIIDEQFPDERLCARVEITLRASGAVNLYTARWCVTRS